MLTVIPFRSEGKTRLPEALRREVALAMLGDVVEAALGVGSVRVVTDDPAGRLVATELGLSKFDASRIAIFVLAGAALVGYAILRPLPDAPAAPEPAAAAAA